MEDVEEENPRGSRGRLSAVRMSATLALVSSMVLVCGSGLLREEESEEDERDEMGEGDIMADRLLGVGEVDCFCDVSKRKEERFMMKK